MPHNLQRRSSVPVILHESSLDNASDSSSITAVILSLQNSIPQRWFLKPSTKQWRPHGR